MPPATSRKSAVKPPQGPKQPRNVVERAIAQCGGSPAELGKRLARLAGEEITRQRVNGWRLRGNFPRNVVPYVHEMTGIPIADLITYRSPFE